MIRSEMSKHADEISHLSLAAEKIRKCEEDNEQLSAKIEELEKENTSLRAQLSILKLYLIKAEQLLVRLIQHA